MESHHEHGENPQHEDDHDEIQPHSHDEHHRHGLFASIANFLPIGHAHGAVEVDSALETSERGIRALKVSLVILGLTAGFQLVITLASGSTALLTDTLHNFSDALTAVPLWVAFPFGRRPPSRRFTYGYGRGEDLAGVAIVILIVASACLAGYESIRKVLEPPEVRHLGWVMAAAIAGFTGNEIVAAYRITTGRQIGSAALVADGIHARADGLTSLAVLGGAVGVLAGVQIADPLVGLLIAGMILFVAKDAAVTMWHRLMDAVEPQVVADIESGAQIDGVVGVSDVRVRWLGHRLQADLHITVDENLATKESHRMAEEVRHRLFHAIPQLAVITVHVDPCGHSGEEAHDVTAHHELAGASR